MPLPTSIWPWHTMPTATPVVGTHSTWTTMPIHTTCLPGVICRMVSAICKTTRWWSFIAPEAPGPKCSSTPTTLTAQAHLSIQPQWCVESFWWPASQKCLMAVLVEWLFSPCSMEYCTHTHPCSLLVSSRCQWLRTTARVGDTFYAGSFIFFKWRIPKVARYRCLS